MSFKDFLKESTSIWPKFRTGDRVKINKSSDKYHGKLGVIKELESGPQTGYYTIGFSDNSISSYKESDLQIA